jgi:hypothetical protein
MNTEHRGGSGSSGERTLGLDEVVTQITVKCMGRTYRATRTAPGLLAITDITDITKPEPLGSARRLTGQGTPCSWEVRTPSGQALAQSSELIDTLATLGEHIRRRWRLASREHAPPLTVQPASRAFTT